VRGTLALLVLLNAAAFGAPQRPAADAQPVILSGRIVAADNDAALRRVRVAVAIPSGRVDQVLTDDDGGFVLRLPSRAALTLTTSKAGYAAMTLAMPAQAADSDVTLRLARGAAIFGRVVDAAGAPVAELPVAVRNVGGAAGGAQHLTTTDDLGEYRLGGLPAGRYRLFVGATPTTFLIVNSGAGSATTVAIGAPPTPAGMPAMLESDQTIAVSWGDDVLAADVRLPPRQTGADRRVQMLAQSASPGGVCLGTAAARVRVITSSGEPLAGAAVRLTAANGPAVLFLGNDTTGADGSIVFDCLRPLDYVIEVSRRGYLLDRFGDRRTLRMSATVRDGEVNDLPTVVLRRAAAAVGAVTDEHGEPMEGVTVKVLAVRYANGRTSAVPIGVERQTDDRGRFRVYGLRPGAYLLAASVDAVPSGAGDDASAYVPTYFPGTPDIGSAAELRIAGEDVTGLDLMFTPSPAARVSGVALDSEGNPVRGRVQLLVSQRSGGVAREPIETPVGTAGEFVLSNVPPGEYALHAIRPAGLGLRTEVGSTSVSVTRGNPPPVTIRTSEGITIAGRIVLEDAERRPLSGVSLTAFPSDFDRAPFPAQGKGMVRLGDGAFYFTGLHGAIRIAMTLGPDGGYVKSVRVGGIDVTDAAVDAAADVDDAEIVISTAGAAISGQTTDPARADDYAVMVFPVDRSLWVAHSRHLKLTPSSADGRFRVSGLPPGAYWAAALEPGDVRIENGGWQDPAFLDQLASQASRVTLGEGERRTVTLRVMR
jgi:hypothetical protein